MTTERRLLTGALVLAVVSLVLFLVALKLRKPIMETASDKLLAEANKLMVACDCKNPAGYKEPRDKFIAAVNAATTDGERVTALAGAAECSYRMGKEQDEYTIELCERLKGFSTGVVAGLRIGGTTMWRNGHTEEGRALVTAAVRMGDPEAAKLIKIMNETKS